MVALRNGQELARKDIFWACGHTCYVIWRIWNTHMNFINLGFQRTVSPRCRKFVTFWERSEPLRKFLSKVKFSMISRGIKRLTMPGNISNIIFLEGFHLHLRIFFILNQIFVLYTKNLIIFLNISSSSNNFWEHCSCIPSLFTYASRA